MKTADFLRKYEVDPFSAEWSLSISDDMADVWDALIEQERYGWLAWTATRHGVFSEAILRKLACQFVRKTPVSGGRTVWDLLTDERSRNAIKVAEAHADGKVTDEELNSACAEALAAWQQTRPADCEYRRVISAAELAAAAAHQAAVGYADGVALGSTDAAFATHVTDSRPVACAARYAAKAAQVLMIAELGNPFREGEVK